MLLKKKEKKNKMAVNVTLTRMHVFRKRAGAVEHCSCVGRTR